MDISFCIDPISPAEYYFSYGFFNPAKSYTKQEDIYVLCHQIHSCIKDREMRWGEENNILYMMAEDI